MKHCLLAFVCGTLLLTASVARAQHSEPGLPSTTPIFQTTPQRPVVIDTGGTEAYTGVFTDLSSGVALDTWALPLGGSFGLIDTVEIGINSKLRLKPWLLQTSVSSLRLYGRVLLLPSTLAAEVALHVPTVFSNYLGLELLVPARMTLGDIELFGQGVMMYAGSSTLDSITFSAAATALFPVIDNLFVAGDLGLGINASKADFGIPGEEVTWSSNFVLPVGVGIGYEILPGLLVKGAFSFTDVATDGAPFDGRAFQVLLVHKDELAGTGPACPPATEYAPSTTTTDDETDDEPQGFEEEF